MPETAQVTTAGDLIAYLNLNFPKIPPTMLHDPCCTKIIFQIKSEKTIFERMIRSAGYKRNVAAGEIPPSVDVNAPDTMVLGPSVTHYLFRLIRGFQTDVSEYVTEYEADVH